MKKTILVTGASTGIGKATALYFAQQGWNVAATMRTPEQASKDLLQQAGLTCLKLDVTDSRSIQEGLEASLKKFGQIDAVMNNAGYGVVGPFEVTSQEQIRRQFETNVFGLMEVTRALLPHFRENRAGTILNIASVGGRLTFPLYSIYHSTKWAVEGFSESLQHELQPFNIRVKIIEPGAIKTDFYNRSQDLAQNSKIKAYDRYVERALRNMQAAGEHGSPPEAVAKVIYGAATDGSWQLRYPASGNAAPLLYLRKVLPDRVFNTIIRAAIMR